jgi:integrase
MTQSTQAVTRKASVQRSAYPDAYAKWEPDAARLVGALTGLTVGQGVCGAGVSARGWTQPVHGSVGSGFRTADRPGHDGVDLIVDKGTAIHAASAGTVSRVRCNAIDVRTGTPWRCDRDGDPVLTAGCDLLTAPSDRLGSSGPALLKVESWVDLRKQLMEGLVGLPRLGKVRATDSPVLPFVVVDESGRGVQPVSAYLQDLVLSDRSAATCRSYAVDLLRWWRLLGVVDVGWERASGGDVAVLVGWMRSAVNPQRRGSAGGVNVKTGKTRLGPGYAAATINHALTVVHGFYSFHSVRGRGPLMNPVPVSAQRRVVLAHRSPLDPVLHAGRAPLRQREPARTPRAIPDALWDELFAVMRNDRDRSLLAFYVSSGARASELLGLRLEHVDWAGQRIWVVSKGTRLTEPVPASGQAFTLLAAYLHQAGLPRDGEPVWRTLRGETRPLSYWALRRILQRANARLGTNWTAHDMRHTAAARMVADPNLTLPEVQTVLRHRHLSSTQLYLRVNVDE